MAGLPMPRVAFRSCRRGLLCLARLARTLCRSAAHGRAASSAEQRRCRAARPRCPALLQELVHSLQSSAAGSAAARSATWRRCDALWRSRRMLLRAMHSVQDGAGAKETASSSTQMRCLAARHMQLARDPAYGSHSQRAHGRVYGGRAATPCWGWRRMPWAASGSAPGADAVQRGADVCQAAPLPARRLGSTVSP